MFRAVILYEGTPDPERYQRHNDEFSAAVPGATFTHGRVIGAPVGDSRYEYFAEFAWPDRESFDQGTRSEEFAASGRDAMEMGIPLHVYLVETD